MTRSHGCRWARPNIKEQPSAASACWAARQQLDYLMAHEQSRGHNFPMRWANLGIVGALWACTNAAVPGPPGESVVSCDFDASPESRWSAASGNLAGANIGVSINNATAYLEHAPGASAEDAGYYLSISATTPANSATSTSFQIPVDATGGLLTVLVQVDSAMPGVHDSTTVSHCSGIAYCAYLPIPSNVNCPSTTTGGCPQGCEVAGPISSLTCQSAAPELCYSSDGAMSCGGESSTATGSWSVTLTSVSRCSDYPNSSQFITYYVVHGSMTANLIGTSGDTTGTATLSLAF